MPKSVVFLRSNPIAPDPRVEKASKALFRNGYKVYIVGWDREGKFKSENLTHADIIRLYIPARFGSGIRNLPYLIKWNIRLMLWLFKHRKKYDYIHACDFDTILPAFVMKVFFGKKVVYDIFDFYSDMLRRVPNIIKRIIKKIDLKIISKVDVVIIADENRKCQIKGSSPRKLIVIYNSPERLNSIDDIEIEINDNKEVIFQISYVGLLQVERGLLEMIEIVKRHPEWRLHLAGYGGDEDTIISVIKDCNNIKFYGRVSYKDALKINKLSDVMFATYDPKIPNHVFSSANKLFEAMMLGKPIIVARNTGMDKLVLKYDLGRVVEYGDLNELEKVLTEFSLMNDKDKKLFAERVKKIYNDYFSWDKMEERLVSLYNNL